MIASESMTSADWMLLALSSVGQDTQKKVGETFVQRLLEKGEIHPAVSILLGLGEYNEAVEVYVSQKYFMEAVLLTCLLFPTDWQRQSFLVRKWGETAVADGDAELAVRCFACTSMESSEPWFSPRAQDEVYAMQQRILAPDTPPGLGFSPISPPGRMHPTQAGLKLVTSFNKLGGTDPTTAVDEKTPMVYGMTPIDAAFSPAGRPGNRTAKPEPASAYARTATPGGYNRKRIPSSSRAGSSRTSDLSTPQVQTAVADFPPTAIKGSRGVEYPASVASSRARSVSASQAGSVLSSGTYQESERGRTGLPSPAQGVFARLREQSHTRTATYERKPGSLMLNVEDVVIDPSLPSSIPSAAMPPSEYTHITGGSQSVAQSMHRGIPSPAMQRAADNLVNSKIRSIDEYINRLDEANLHNLSHSRNENRSRNTNRPASRTQERAPSETRGRGGVRYIRPAKRSPSSPVSMSPDDPALQVNKYAFDDERFYKITSPVESEQNHQSAEAQQSAVPRQRGRSKGPGTRSASRARRAESEDREGRRTRSRSRAAVTNRRQESEEALQTDRRGRSTVRGQGSTTRSPSSPRPMSPAGSTMSRTVGERVRARSSSRRPRSPPGRERRAPSPDPSIGVARATSRPPMPKLQTNVSENNVLARTKKEIAAQELEARRLSLAQRAPTAPDNPPP